MMRYFLVFYVAKQKLSGEHIIGHCTMTNTGGKSAFLNNTKTRNEIHRLNLEGGIDTEQIVLTGFNEITKEELEDWNS